MADLFPSEQGKRLFGFIGAGGTAGAVLGPVVTIWLSAPLGPVNLLIVAAALLELAVLCVYRIERVANPPTEVMLAWNTSAGDWEHRAYWGANNIPYGTDGTASRRYVGALPAAGQWVRLEVAASGVGLEGVTLQGMSFVLYDGRATWDYAGKSSSSSTNPPPTLPTVAVTATTPNASETGPVSGVFTVTRTGSTTSSLAVNYSLGGTPQNGVMSNAYGPYPSGAFEILKPR